MSNDISQLLSRIRRRIRLFILVETGVVVAIALSIMFWFGLLIDWWWEPSRDLRILAWWVVGTGLAVLLYEFLWLRLRRHLSDCSMALLVERANPELRERLLTAVAPAPGSNPSPFLDSIRHEANHLSSSYSPAAVISFQSLRPRIATVLVLLATIACFAYWQRDAFATWMDRLALSESRWPRRVHLTVEGFEPDAQGHLVQSIPRYESAELVVLADLTGSYQAPDEVQVRYRAPGQTEERALLARVGEAEKGRDATQEYRFSFSELREPLELEIRGGDDRLTNLFIDVLPRPRISSLEIEAKFPDYLRMSPRQLSATSVVTVPIGTTLTIVGRASQALKQVDVSTTIEGLTPPRVAIDESKRHGFNLTLEKLPAMGELSFLPIDVAGVAAREPYMLTLIAQADELPTATAQLVGIGNSVTPNARIPLQVRAEDDHAVDQTWLELIVDGQPNRKIAVPPVPGESAVETDSEVDLEALAADRSGPLALQPGQRLSFVVRAIDAWNLSDEPRIGSSRMITLDIVTADQLLESLEREEINLRRTFERVIEKTGQCGDKLGKIALDGGENSDEALQLARIQLARVEDDVHQVIDETTGVAAGFQLVHDQLVNNRTGDEELRSRLRERIAEPLRSIAERDLRMLASAIDGTGHLDSPSDRGISGLRRHTAEVVDRMQLVLAEMKSLETYSEVVSMLRKLIQEQQDLTEKTRQDQRKQLRTLLEE